MAVTDISEAARTRARGALVELAGGEFRLRFDWNALEEIEKEFGSSRAFEDAKNACLLGKGYGPILKVVRSALAAGLVPQLQRSLLKEALEQERRERRLFDLLLAIHDAWLEAWPKAEAEPEADSGKGGGETDDSPSAPTSTPSRSTSAGRRKTSGA